VNDELLSSINHNGIYKVTTKLVQQTIYDGYSNMPTNSVLPVAAACDSHAELH